MPPYDTSTLEELEPQLRPLSAARKAKLRDYWSRLDKGAGGCRVGGRHWILGLEEYDGEDPNFTIEPMDGQQGVYQIVTYCRRCGIPYIYSTEKTTGHLRTKGRADYTRAPHYLFTEENGGDGTPMTAADRAYLRSLQFEEALAVKKALAAKRAPKFKAASTARRPRNAKPLVMDTKPAEAVFRSTG